MSSSCFVLASVTAVAKLHQRNSSRVQHRPNWQTTSRTHSLSVATTYPVRTPTTAVRSAHNSPSTRHHKPSTMGKRKSSSKPQGPKKREPLATTFTCLFCNHEKSITVKVDKKAGVGTLNCSVCAQSFQCGANYLSAPIDIYSEWVDAAGTSL